MKRTDQALMKPPSPSWVAATASREKQPRQLKSSEKSGGTPNRREELTFSQPKLIPFLHEVAALLAAQVRLELSPPQSTQLH